MTLFFPDVSEYTPNLDVSRYPIVLARATLSDRVADSTYKSYEQKSAGKVFVAYHWLNHGNLAAQAHWCFEHVGPSVPVMIDAEDEAGNTGYNGPLTIDDILGFAAAYRALGGQVSLVYMPFWYWSGAMGAPHRLGELTAAGLGLVSSNYPNAGYTENGPGWAPYYAGAPAPVQWQYTSTPIDMNAYRGTVDDYRALVGVPQAKNNSVEVGSDMPFLAIDEHGTVYLCSDDFKSHVITDPKVVDGIVALHQTGARRLGSGQGNIVALATDWQDWGNEPKIVRTGWNPQMYGPVDQAPAPIDTHALATDIAQQLVAAGVTGLTPEQLTAAIKAGLDGATIHTA